MFSFHVSFFFLIAIKENCADTKLEQRIEFLSQLLSQAGIRFTRRSRKVVRKDLASLSCPAQLSVSHSDHTADVLIFGSLAPHWGSRSQAVAGEGHC